MGLRFVQRERHVLRLETTVDQQRAARERLPDPRRRQSNRACSVVAYTEEALSQPARWLQRHVEAGVVVPARDVRDIAVAGRRSPHPKRAAGPSICLDWEARESRRALERDAGRASLVVRQNLLEADRV